MSEENISHTPGPWLDWDTLEWLHSTKYLLANTADARLMAASPEILAALKEAEAYVETLHSIAGDKGDRRQVIAVLKNMRSAIAKAETPLARSATP